MFYLPNMRLFKKNSTSVASVNSNSNAPKSSHSSASMNSNSTASMNYSPFSCLFVQTNLACVIAVVYHNILIAFQ